jgi:hypothetical protein
MLKIVFEFVGGPNDGKVFHRKLGKSSDAERYYLLTNHGAVGQRCTPRTFRMARIKLGTSAAKIIPRTVTHP